MDIDKLVTTAKNSYQTNKYRSYKECYNDGVLVLADMIRQQLLQQTDCSTLREILVQMQHRQAELFQLAKDKTEKESVIKNMEGISTVLRLISDMPPVA